MIARLAVAAALAVLSVGCRLRDQSSAASDAGNAADVDTDSSAGQGYLAVQARQCAQCHQSPDPGDGVLSGQDTPVPGTMAYGTNLTPDPDTGQDVQDAGTIAAAILRSTALDGGPLCPAMPAYADAGMGGAEALNIAAYLQGLTPVWHPVPSSTCAARPAGDGG
jgi:mono/diheme cytochrome c family protein